MNPPDIPFYSEEKSFTRAEREKAVQFFQNVENYQDRLGIENTVTWLSPALHPQCDTHKDRVANTIARANALMSRLENLNENDSSNFTWALSDTMNELRSIKEKAITEGIAVNISHWEKYMLEGSSDRESILDEWTHPLCSQLQEKPLDEVLEVSYKEQVIDRIQNGTAHFLDAVPVIPLPPEATWNEVPVGLGFPALRQQAVVKADEHPHLKLKNCSL